MLTINNLRSGYGKMEVVHGVDIVVDKNSIVAIVGPNGSGKSTILKSIFGLCDIFSGEIGLDGENLTHLKKSELISFGISYAPQGKHVFEDMTVRENLEMGAFSLKGKERISESISDVYREFPVLKEKAETHATKLSGGEKQMLSIGRALVANPKLLILDEPTLGLAPLSRKQIIQKIIEIKKEKGISVLLVEQNAKEALETADKTYVIEDGKVAMTAGKEIIRDDKIRKIYFREE